MKQCTKCAEIGVGPKPRSDFCRNKSNADGLQVLCREHSREYNRAWAKRFPEKNRAKGKRFREARPAQYRRLWIRQNLKKNYGLTVQQYDEMFEAQGGACAICKKALVRQTDDARPMLGQPADNVGRVDHCHETNSVRGILCFGCNVGLGKFRDDEELMLTAVRYLRASRATAHAISRAQTRSLQGEIGPHPRDPESSPRRGSRRDELSPFFHEE